MAITAKDAELQELASYLRNLNKNVIINNIGESFPPAFPNAQAVVNYVNAGGVYIDYCGWPMYYEPGNIADPNRFGRFLSALGADPNYCSGFDVTPLSLSWRLPGGYSSYRNCGLNAYPFPRSWTTWRKRQYITSSECPCPPSTAPALS